MEDTLAAALGMLAAIAVTALISRRTGLPSPVLLVVEGVVWALLPTPNVSIDPDVVLTLVLPPLLYSAALDSSLVAVRANRRWILSLAVGLVLVTTFAIGGVASALIPGMGFATACVLGAVVAPNDAIAAGAVGRTVPLPERLQHIFEGESLLNDATALTVYGVAVDAVRSGGFSLPGAIGRFALTGGGGAAIGLAVAVLLHEVKRRLDDALVENCLSLATPFLAYLPAEEAHTSGVVAVVVTGLWLGHRSSTYQSGGTRLQVTAVWRLLTFGLEGLVFLLIGLDLAHILDGLDHYRAGDLALWSAVVLVAVLAIRPAYVFPVVLLRRLPTREPGLGSWRVPAALSWVGMRGVVTLAAAEAIPVDRADGSPFPQRDLLLLLAFVVAFGSLVLQGLTFGQLLRRLGLGRDTEGLQRQRTEAVDAAVHAGLERLDQETAGDPASNPEVVESLRTSAERRREASRDRLEHERHDITGRPEPAEQALRRLRLAMIESERAELVRRRNAGHLSDALLRELEGTLDLEERTLERRRASAR